MPSGRPRTGEEITPEEALGEIARAIESSTRILRTTSRTRTSLVRVPRAWRGKTLVVIKAERVYSFILADEDGEETRSGSSRHAAPSPG